MNCSAPDCVNHEKLGNRSETFSGNGTSGENENIYYKAQCTDDREEWEHFLNMMMVVVSSVLIIVGTFGNVVAIWVFRQKSYKNNVMAGALQYLAVIDLMIIWTNDIEIFVRGPYGFNYDFLSKYQTICVLHYYGKNLLIGLDAWILIYVTLTRYIHIRFPFHSHKLCSKFIYNLCFAAIHVVLIGFTAVFLALAYVNWPKHIPDGEICYFVALRTEKKNPKVVVITSLLNYIIPVIVICILNVFTIIQLWKVETRRKALCTGPQSASVTTSVHHMHHTSSIQVTSTTPSLGLASNNNDKASRKDGDPFKTPCTDGRLYAANIFDEMPLRVNDTNDNRYAINGSTDVDSSKPLQQSAANDNTMESSQGLMTNRKDPVSFDKDLLKASPSNLPKKSTDASTQELTKKEKEKCKRDSSRDRDSRVNNLTLLLVVTSFVYIVTTVPYVVFSYYAAQRLLQYYEGCIFRLIISYGFFMLLLSNYSVNFYFYAAIGSQFRTELLRLWRRHFCGRRGKALKDKIKTPSHTEN